MPEWIYYAENDQAIIRVPATGAAKITDRPAQRYWGRGNWLARDRYCGNWTEVLWGGGYRQVSAEKVPAIVEHIDAMVGGTFRDRHRFWPDQASDWTQARARARVTRLKANLGPDSDHDTVQSYFDDSAEVRRLEDFIGGR